MGAVVIACGGSSFTTDLGDGGGGGVGGSSGSGSGAGSGSGGASSGGSSGTASSSGTSGSTSSGGSSSGSSGGSGSSGSSSGTTSSGSSGVSSSSGASSSSSGGCLTCNDGGPAPVCPPPPAPNQGSCMSPGLQCEYGASTVQSCNTVVLCSSRLDWTLTPASGTDCGAPRPSACPTTFAGAALDGTCTPSGTLCDYPQGRCDCVLNALVGAAPIMLVDASAPASHWVCQNPANANCPTPRPLLGTFCGQPNLLCDYGSCYVDGGTSEVCQGGVWQPASVECPG
jgi:hypothetical protein